MKEKEKAALTPVQESVAELQEKKHLGLLKVGEQVGALKISRFNARFAEYMELHTLIVSLDNNAHAAYGMDQKEFCKEFAGISYETVNNFRNLCKKAKAEVVVALKAMGQSNQAIELLKTSDDEDTKALMSKGTLVVGKEEIQVTAENMPRIIKHIEKVVNKNVELEAEKEELEKKLLSKYDMADRNKKLEEKNKTLELDKKILERKYEQAKHGLSEEDVRSLGALRDHKDLFDSIIAQVEAADVRKYSEKVRLELLGFVEYMDDRAALACDLIKNRYDERDPVPDAILDEDKKRFTAKYGEGAL